MKKKLKILGLIGIRSGSKELINKNILKLGNKHLVGWIIAAAKKSTLINRIIVSTDDIKYSNIVKKYGAEVPFLRPKILAKDKSKEIDFIKYTIKKLKKKRRLQTRYNCKNACDLSFSKKYRYRQCYTISNQQ